MSTGLECEFFEREDGWRYILQNYDCPVGAWDWREFATTYGPFPTLRVAQKHLRDYHANPGGYSVSPLHPERWDWELDEYQTVRPDGPETLEGGLIGQEPY